MTEHVEAAKKGCPRCGSTRTSLRSMVHTPEGEFKRCVHFWHFGDEPKLPAPAEEEKPLCKHCKLPIRKTGNGRIRNEWEHMDGMSYCKGASTYAWPISVVEEKAAPSNLCIHCNRRLYLYKETLVHVHSTSAWCDGEKTKCKLHAVSEAAPSGEEKQPSASRAWCGSRPKPMEEGDTNYFRARSEWIAYARVLEGALAESEKLRGFPMKINPKPQPDSSSISTEQTFEEWWNRMTAICEDGPSPEEEGIARAAWNAAKGQI